jgi:NADPH:quinone reductase
LLQATSGVYLTFFGSLVFGTPGFLCQTCLFNRSPQMPGRLDVKPNSILRFEEMREAHRVMEAGEARGRMVAVHD